MVLTSMLVCFPGCGTTKSVTATEQLLMSDAVDTTISKIDFRPLAGYKVFLDTTYVVSAGKAIPGVPVPFNLVNSDYVISGLRQQLTAAGCMLVDTKDTAEIICEARCGALGTDGNNVTYGLPASNLLSSASSMIASAPPIPTIPEISIAKREMKSAAAKISVFAYDRETREPLWQSGVAQAGSNARDTWFLGTRFAGKRVGRRKLVNDELPAAKLANGIDHRGQHIFASQLFAPKAPPDVEESAESHLAESKDEATSIRSDDSKPVRATLSSDKKPN
jgi:hypothetical protein